MKILLTAINAKYIHSNLAVYSLQAYSAARGRQAEIAEYTINQRMDDILEEIYRRKPDLLVFSCYIWNIDQIVGLAEEFHKICPEVPVWAGGPEVSFETERFLREHPAFDGVMMGEGERTFFRLCEIYELSETEYEKREALLRRLDGISFRRSDGTIAVQPLKELLSMDELPFCYENVEDFRNRIIYYESSRGCPFSCSYCLSSVDKTLRFRSLSLVFSELQFFLDQRVSQVKLVDRTFNCRRDHAMAVWRYIRDHDNGVTNFHFEVSADLLTEEELDLIAGMRPGLIQLEIGVQSVSDRTIREIHRTMDLEKVHAAVCRVQKGRNVHQHLDLIAGLPYENYETFQHSFDAIYRWKPDQLQLGFLKVLKGSYMYEHAEEYGLIFRSRAPYEVLCTRWISYQELTEVHLVERMLEQMYNSGLFRTALALLEQVYESPFRMYLDMGHFYRKQGWLEAGHSRVQWTEMFLKFAVSEDEKREDWYKEALMFDLYRIEKSKSRPSWAVIRKEDVRANRQYLCRQGMEKKYCHIEPFYYLEIDRDGRPVMEAAGAGGGAAGENAGGRALPARVLFDYERRDPLTNEAALKRILPEEMKEPFSAGPSREKTGKNISL